MYVPTGSPVKTKEYHSNVSLNCLLHYFWDTVYSLSLEMIWTWVSAQQAARILPRPCHHSCLGQSHAHPCLASKLRSLCLPIKHFSHQPSFQTQLDNFIMSNRKSPNYRDDFNLVTQRGDSAVGKDSITGTYSESSPAVTNIYFCPLGMRKKWTWMLIR